MYEMRPAIFRDRPAITALIQARSAWMREYRIDLRRPRNPCTALVAPFPERCDRHSDSTTRRR
ncbi:hypothetical protein DKG71_00250 [Streptomyces sp. NEAU-S7GS2]|nr:hypothetical protein DKG71_00250 [Streptomyces sp. NEAU-S7GS2]